MMRPLLCALALSCTAVPVLHGQPRLERHCELPAEFGAREPCLTAAQAVTSAQPALGILVAGGNPTLGSAGIVGLRLGAIPRLSAGLRLHVVGIRLPDILAAQVPGQVGDFSRRFAVPAPSLLADASVSVFQGYSVAPGLGGVGAVSLIGTASYLPFRLLGVDGFDTESLAFGAGARVHLLRESFVVPGVSIAALHRRLGTLGFGDICPAGTLPLSVGPSPDQQISACSGGGDPGEFTLDLVDWSTRLVASKRLLGIGLTAGLGHDRYGSDLDFGFRGRQPVPGTELTPVVRIANEQLSANQWSIFGNLSYSLLIGTIGLEGGWQQGTRPLSGFRDFEGDFDPRAGNWFGSFGGRLAL